MKKLVLLLVVCVLAVTIAGQPVSAETNLNLYLGMSNASSLKVKEGRSSVIGGRLQYWLPTNEFFGVGFDIFSFKTNAIDLLAESGLAMLRVPLGKDSQYPTGKFFPYLAAGPALISGTGMATLALDFKGGIAWYVDTNLAIFGEHRLLNSTEIEIQQFVGGIQFKF
ncbi:MAG: hypothetical protein HYW34_04155 [Candidatus Brennerbacteria bacterium]|nr:hypothetical protein [Candidatus Brennerbacteria bacterium]